MKKGLKHILVLYLYMQLTCFLLYPLPLKFSTGLLDARSGDPLMQMWVVQWNIHKLTSSLSQYFDANIFYPYSNTFAYHDHMFGLGLLGLPIYAITQNPIATYNVLLILSFILSAYGMYLLCKEITQNDYAAFLAGLIFGLLPYRFAHLDHLNLLSVQWLPFCFLFLTRYLFSNAEATRGSPFRRNVSTIALFWVFFLLQVLTSFNYLFMLVFMIAIYIVTVAFFQWRKHARVFVLCSKRTLLLFMLGGCLTGLLLLPFILPYFKANREMGFQRTLQEVESLSARIQDYLVAPENNALYGQFTKRFQYPKTLFAREHTLFNGILPTLLALLGMVGIWNIGTLLTKIQRRKSSFWTSWARNNDISNGEVLRPTYIVLLIMAGILSLGPSATLFGKTFPLPYAWLYYVVPGFKSMRVPARFGLFVSFSLTVLAALGLSQVYNYLWKPAGDNENTFNRLVITGLLGGMLLFEYYSPPEQLSFYPGTKDTIPAVYQWLAQQPGNTPIIELPVRSAKDNFEYAYYSTFHWQPMINGRSAFIPNGILQVFREMREFPSARTVDLLKALGIQYIIVHTDKLEQKLPLSLPKGITIAQVFDHDLVLAVSRQLSFNSQHLNVQYHIPSSLRPDDVYVMYLSFGTNTPAPFSSLPHEEATLQIEWMTSAQAVVHKDFGEIALPLLLQGGEQIRFPVRFTTPSESGEYHVVFETTTPVFEPQQKTKPVTISPNVLDSRYPGKLQAQFVRTIIPNIWKSGEPLPVRVLVKNTGDTLWKARVADRTHPVGEVHLGVADWQNVSSGKSLKESHQELFLSRGFLPYDVVPGEEVLITANVKTPERAGEYLVQFDMVSELIQWFSDQGSQPFTKKIVLK